jgi:hypothetical protein
MFETSLAVARDRLSRRRRTLRAVFASFDDEVLLCDCASVGVTCDGPSVEREAP